MKAQVSLEFLASFLIFLMAAVTVFNTVSDQAPEFVDVKDRESLYLESKYMTDHIMTKEGYHSYGGGGTEWERNQSTRNSIQAFGLADKNFVIDAYKLDNLTDRGNSLLNYSQFRNVMGLENQYRFNFTVAPVAETEKTFRRGSPPASPGINEPSDPLYSNAEPEVHYGKVSIGSNDLHLLVTAHDGSYNTTWASSSWDFSSSSPIGIQERTGVPGLNFRIEGIQDFENNRGNLVVLSDRIKTFGPSVDTDADSIKINRYAAYEDRYGNRHPIRIEVIAW